MRHLIINPLLVAFALSFLPGIAQPAAAPGRVWVVAQASPTSDDGGPGNEDHPFKSIAPAAAAAGPDDTVIVHRGVYRERVSPARGGEPGRPVTYQAATDERVVITGADPWSPSWDREKANPAIRSAVLDLPVTGTYNPFLTAQLTLPGRTLGQVFLNDEPLAEMPDRAAMNDRAGTWWIDPASRRLYIHFPAPSVAALEPRVELTMRDRLFAPHMRGLGYITVRGFIFERAANQFPLRFWLPDDFVTSYPQAGAVGTRSGHNWVIEDNVVRYAQSIGIDCGDEGGRDPEGTQPKPTNIGHHLIRGNRVSDNGCTGIMGWGSHGTTITRNIIERNNSNGSTAPECAGIKMHDFVDGTITGNLIRDNDCAGIWLDCGYTGARIARNLIVGNRDMGIFVELGVGPALLDNNVIAQTRGDGIYLHDASGVTAAHNLLWDNAHFGFYAHVISERETVETHRKSETSHVQVLNNVFIDNYVGAISLPAESPRSSNNQSDSNLFLSGTQSYWEGELFTRFRVNTNGHRIDPKTIASSLKRADAPQDKDLSFENWKKVTGWETNSRSLAIANKRRPDFMKGAGPEMAARLSALGLFFEMRSGDVIAQMTVPPVQGIETDYEGNRMPNGSIHPGSFQLVSPGLNHIPLWPQPEANSLPLPK